MNNVSKDQMKAVVDAVTKRFVDEGKIIEAGFAALRAVAIPAEASPVQITEMRKAFFAGAQHLWASIFSFLEGGSEETPGDLKRMEQVQKELSEFADTLKRELREGLQ